MNCGDETKGVGGDAKMKHAALALFVVVAALGTAGAVLAVIAGKEYKDRPRTTIRGWCVVNASCATRFYEGSCVAFDEGGSAYGELWAVWIANPSRAGTATVREHQLTNKQHSYSKALRHLAAHPVGAPGEECWHDARDKLAAWEDPGSGKKWLYLSLGGAATTVASFCACCVCACGKKVEPESQSPRSRV